MYKKLDDLIEATEKREVGNVVMNYELQTIDGQKVMLHDILGDGITVIDVWASWCSYCRKLIPEYKAAAKKYRNKNIKFVFLSLDKEKEQWEKAIHHDGIEEFVNISSLKGGKDDMKLNYRMFGIPDNLIVDKNGKIIANHKREILKYLNEYYSENK
jgi:thiol-disulfide isomerase/thioredoxin